MTDTNTTELLQNPELQEQPLEGPPSDAEQWAEPPQMAPQPPPAAPRPQTAPQPRQQPPPNSPEFPRHPAHQAYPQSQMYPQGHYQQPYPPQPPYYQQAFHRPPPPMPMTPPAPPLPLSSAFLTEWSTPRSYGRVVRVTYLTQTSATAYDDRHKLFIPEGVVLDLAELQGHAQMCGWPHMPIRLWFELSFEPQEGDRYITSCVCRPPEMAVTNPQMAVVMKEIEAMKAQAPEKEKTWFDQLVNFVFTNAPLIKVWFDANWQRIKDGFKGFIEWVADLFRVKQLEGVQKDIEVPEPAAA